MNSDMNSHLDEESDEIEIEAVAIEVTRAC